MTAGDDPMQSAAPKCQWGFPECGLGPSFLTGAPLHRCAQESHFLNEAAGAGQGGGLRPSSLPLRDLEGHPSVSIPSQQLQEFI